MSEQNTSKQNGTGTKEVPAVADGSRIGLRQQAFDMLKELPRSQPAIETAGAVDPVEPPVATPPAPLAAPPPAPEQLTTAIDSALEINEEKTTEVIHEGDEDLYTVKAAMDIGQTRFGITCTGKPIMNEHWLSDSSVYGDQIMALPSSVLVAGRTKQAGGVAVDMLMFLDAIIEGAGKLEGIPGIVEASTLPAWTVSRLMGSFPALMGAYNEAIDQTDLAIEAAARKAAIGMKVTNSRKLTKNKDGKKEESEEVLVKELAPDPALSKFILANRMKGRYKDDGDVKQAVQINFIGAEADL